MPKAAAAARADIPRAIFRRVRAFCVANADPAIVQKYSRFFVEGYDAYGVDHKQPAWQEQRDACALALRQAGPPAFLDAGDLLIATGKYEEASFAIEFVIDSRDHWSPAVFDRVGRWFEGGIRNWAHSDLVCGDILGPMLAGGIVGLDALSPWRDSPFKFKRRAVPVTLLSVLKQTADFHPLLERIEPLMRDREKVVCQGMGWLLREAWKLQPKPVEAFLLRHKDTCPRLIVQYATERMDQAARERFRRSPVARAGAPKNGDGPGTAPPRRAEVRRRKARS